MEAGKENYASPRLTCETSRGGVGVAGTILRGQNDGAPSMDSMAP